ncbi:MAG: rhomboid family intramembrane serine protease [Verrucomicrobia bacterium]|nr:rhomboid family intramembrane serine protease [Verrucomicrobiota bacterium]
MRIIGYLATGRQALEFSQFLSRERIDNRIEEEGDRFGIWVIDEDRLEEALRLFEEFQKNPTDPQYGIRLARSPATSTKKQGPLFSGSFKMGTLTLLLLAISTLLFMLSAMTSKKEGNPQLHEDPLINTPIYQALLYDLPDKLPYWEGAYGEVIKHARHKEASWTGSSPLFEQIREGEVWRIFTPAVLHGSFLHLFFNAIWILILGNQVEGRIGKMRYAILCLLTAGISNTAQYLMSGPFFFGLSGIVCALFGFIWMRQRLAPWEGYQLNKITRLFIALYIALMALLSLVSFVMQLQGSDLFTLPIANTAHVVGLIVGALLGRLNLSALQEAS